METVFWLIAGLMVLVALAIVLIPLWRQQALPTSDQDQFNIEIARQRLEELKNQLQDKQLTQQQFDEQYLELEQALGHDLALAHETQVTGKQGRWMAGVILLLLPAGAIALYLLIGHPIALDESFVKSQQQAKNDQLQIENMIAKLAERLKKQPDDAKGWMMLGRSMMYMRQANKAVTAFQQAYRLLGDTPEVMLSLADALAMAQGGRFAGQPEQLIFKVLEIAPEDGTALWLGGMAKAEAGEFKLALQYWYQLEGRLPKDSQAYQELQGLISEVLQQHPGLANDSEAEKTAAIAPAAITVSVALAGSVKQLADAGDTVFIYAQALTGAKMPLAIVRKTVADLPLEIKLDDTMAMMPAMKLSNFKQVRVLARVSKSAAAMQQPGDLLGMFEPVTIPSDQPVNIMIDRVVN